jgi:hypothetical protein
MRSVRPSVIADDDLLQVAIADAAVLRVSVLDRRLRSSYVQTSLINEYGRHAPAVILDCLG